MATKASEQERLIRKHRCLEGAAAALKVAADAILTRVEVDLALSGFARRSPVDILDSWVGSVESRASGWPGGLAKDVVEIVQETVRSVKDVQRDEGWSAAAPIISRAWGDITEKALDYLLECACPSAVTGFVYQHSEPMTCTECHHVFDVKVFASDIPGEVAYSPQVCPHCGAGQEHWEPH